MDSELSEFLEAAKEAAWLGGEILLEKLGTAAVREKGYADFVTEADLACQEAIVARLSDRFPAHRFLSEEGALAVRPQSVSHVWILDPLDGTTNYVHQIPFFSVSLALEIDGELAVGVILDPSLGELFWAAAGGGAFLNGRPIRASNCQALSDALVSIGLPARISRESVEIAVMTASAERCQSLRRTGSAALNLAYLAAGRHDLAWAFTTKPWDVAAGTILLREAGGVISAPDGSPLNLQQERVPYVAAASPELQTAFLNLIQPLLSRAAISGIADENG
ncbi:MAG: inositol monophosphatase [Thermogutta sp.]|nr:inositol monophosphatase [Thermogutta sp.]